MGGRALCEPVTRKHLGRGWYVNTRECLAQDAADQARYNIVPLPSPAYNKAEIICALPGPDCQ